jgi:hypothetical protein
MGVGRAATAAILCCYLMISKFVSILMVTAQSMFAREGGIGRAWECLVVTPVHPACFFVLVRDALWRLQRRVQAGASEGEREQAKVTKHDMAVSNSETAVCVYVAPPNDRFNTTMHV